MPAGTPVVTAEEPDHPDEVFYNTTLSFVGEEHQLAAAVTAELPSRLEDDEMGTPSASMPDDDHLGLRLPHRAQLRDLAGKLWPENCPTFQLGGYTRGIGAPATDHMWHTRRSRWPSGTSKRGGRPGNRSSDGVGRTGIWNGKPCGSCGSG
ncbi:hypothetical protein ABZ896_43730 [Streptomyces sp. NPDC047072]|uniref:hypothetical protein n=1 Tax=Streptomyces sp. NPDC047072 TaxID=3154809 RepID=UPI0033E0639D